jgi:hypothetical protein
MKKMVIVFILGSVVKGLLLFLTVLANDIAALFPFLIFFALVGLVDRRILIEIQPLIKSPNWLKLTGFTYGTFVSILWITGPLFRTYNYIFSIEPTGDGSMPTAPLVVFLLLGFIVAAMTAIMWMRKTKTAANAAHVTYDS